MTPPAFKNYKNENINMQAKDLKKVLDDYGIKGDILRAKEGPVVTRYELEPAPGTRSARIISLSMILLGQCQQSPQEFL